METRWHMCPMIVYHYVYFHLHSDLETFSKY